MNKCYIFYLFFALILLGCQSNKAPVVIDYGPIFKKSTSYEILVNPKDYQSYDSLYSRIDKIACNDSLPVILLDLGLRIKKIKLVHSCDKTGLFKKKNNLRIRDDIIKLNKDYQLSKLDSLIHAHYSNYGVSPYLSEHPKKAFVSIGYTEFEFSKFTELLDNITNSFNDLDLELPFVLMLDDRNGTSFL